MADTPDTPTPEELTAEQIKAIEDAARGIVPEAEKVAEKVGEEVSQTVTSVENEIKQ